MEKTRFTCVNASFALSVHLRECMRSVQCNGISSKLLVKNVEHHLHFARKPSISEGKYLHLYRFKQSIFTCCTKIRIDSYS